MNAKKYAHVALTTKTKKLDKLFSYEIPENIIERIEIGAKVIVPFGLSNKISEGYIIEFCETCQYSGVKEILSVIDELSLSENQIKLALWMKKKYLCSISDAINIMTPPGTTIKEIIYIKKGSLFEESLPFYEKACEMFTKNNQIEIKKLALSLEIKVSDIKKLVKDGVFCQRKDFYTEIKALKVKMISLTEDENFLEEALEIASKRTKKPLEIYEYLKENEVEREDVLKKQFKVNSEYLDKLIDKNILEYIVEDDFQIPKIKKEDDCGELRLNFDQDFVFKEIEANIKKQISNVFLLQGVTGSGKTEVYIKLVRESLNMGKTSIILVPEISLTPQTVGKFYKEFGDEVALFHSKLSFRERYDQWRKVKSGDKRIIVGARSAIMAPCENIGIIILDEEHDDSYKSDRNPKYQSREVAKYLAHLNNSVLVLGSATPSMDSLYQCELGNYEKLNMNRRYNNNKMPEIQIVDMRRELTLGNKTIFSNDLVDSINECLTKKEQVILFLNRKGYSTFIKCRECGYSLKCPNCDISLTYHKYDSSGKCSYCGYSQKVDKKCPSCGSNYFRHFGIGTEKIEEITKNTFEDAIIGRVDGVIATKKGAVEKVLNSFKNRDIDILIGTQMISKGLDFSNVTLVGVLSADILLNLPDYLANERAFQILTQVSGRSGRGDAGGKVIIQTYSPESFVIDAVSRYDFDNFIYQESILRKEYKYPPYYNLANIIFTSEDNSRAEQVSNRVRKLADEIIMTNKLNIEEILGPNPAIYSKIKNRHRWQIIIKYKKENFLILRKLLSFLCVDNIDKISYPDVTVTVDIDSTKLL